MAEVSTATQIVTYQPRYAEAFAKLNYQWIEQFFSIEDVDRKALDFPEEYARDGEIFFVLVENEAVGTVAMVPYVNNENIENNNKENESGLVLELAKMAVRPDQQGKGHSRLLMQTCIDYARSRGAREIMLQTNDVLAPALALYKSFGFAAFQQVGDDRYSRANLEMRLGLESC